MYTKHGIFRCSVLHDDDDGRRGGGGNDGTTTIEIIVITTISRVRVGSCCYCCCCYRGRRGGHIHYIRSYGSLYAIRQRAECIQRSINTRRERQRSLTRLFATALCGLEKNSFSSAMGIVVIRPSQNTITRVRARDYYPARRRGRIRRRHVFVRLYAYKHAYEVGGPVRMCVRADTV